MNKNKKIIIILALTIILAIVFGWRSFKAGSVDFYKNVEQEKNQSANDLEKTYVNESYNFTFVYPSDYTISEIDEEANGGVTIFAEGTGEQNSFQIFIAPFEEPGSITPERIKNDLPKIVIDEPQNILISGKIVPALMFFGKSDLIPRTREIWFVKNNNLYQVTAYDNMDDIIGPILDSLEFQ